MPTVPTMNETHGPNAFEGFSRLGKVFNIFHFNVYLKVSDIQLPSTPNRVDHCGGISQHAVSWCGVD